MHGSTAVGVASANAGALIVRGNRKTDIDTILHGADGATFPDTVFMLQQLGYGCFWTTDPAAPYDYLITKAGLFKTDGTVIPNEGKREADVGDAKVGPIAEWTCHPSDQEQKWWRTKTGNGTVTPGVVENFNTQLFSAKVWDVNGRFTSINGVVQPTLTVPAGQIQRWRFVHGGIHDTINLQIVKMTPPAANGPTGPLYGALSNRTVKEQAPVVNQVCKAAPDTLIPQFEIAADGLTRTHIYKVGTTGTGGGAIPGTSAANYLQPGYRSDVLVAFPSEGDYCLLDQAAPDSARVKNGGGGGQGPDSPRLLAYVHVRGGRAVPGDLEQHLKQTLYDSNSALSPAERNGLLAGNLTPWAPFTELAPPGDHVQPHVYFEIGKAGFTVNGETYQPDKVQPLLIRQVGTTDDWKVRVDPVDPKGGAAPHIFHIHINPFEIIDVRQLHVDAKGQATGTGESIFDANGKCLPKFEVLAGNYCGQYHVFRDTLFIQNGFEATLRTHYADYTGEFVLHCHILDHEDAGMMANVMIVQDRAHPPKPAQRQRPAAHRMPAPH
jgi:FtsP/CotA-like multicopper oxidase with cupredoxin domain